MKQVYTPDVGLRGSHYAGLCLQWVDDAGQSPERSNTAKRAYEKEQDNGRLMVGDIPEGLYCPIWFEFTKGSFTYPDGSTVYFKDAWHVAHAIRVGGVYTITDSEVAYGARQPYKAIAEVEGWFRMYGAKYVGYSTHCDGREYVKKENNMTKSEAYTVTDGFYRWGTGGAPTPQQSEYWADRMSKNTAAVDELYQAMKKAAQDSSGYMPAGELFVKIKK